MMDIFLIVLLIVIVVGMLIMTGFVATFRGGDASEFEEYTALVRAGLCPPTYLVVLNEENRNHAKSGNWGSVSTDGELRELGQLAGRVAPEIPPRRVKGSWRKVDIAKFKVPVVVSGELSGLERKYVLDLIRGLDIYNLADVGNSKDSIRAISKCLAAVKPRASVPVQVAAPVPAPVQVAAPVPAPVQVAVKPVPVPVQVAVKPVPAPVQVAVKPVPTPVQVAVKPVPAPVQVAAPVPAPVQVAVKPVPTPVQVAVEPVTEPDYIETLKEAHYGRTVGNALSNEAKDVAYGNPKATNDKNAFLANRDSTNRTDILVNKMFGEYKPQRAKSREDFRK